MLRRQPRRKRSANRLGGLLPVVSSAVTFFFPLSVGAGEQFGYGQYLSSDAGGVGCYILRLWTDRAVWNEAQYVSTPLSIRCVRAREEQAVPLFWFREFFSFFVL